MYHSGRPQGKSIDLLEEQSIDKTVLKSVIVIIYQYGKTMKMGSRNPLVRPLFMSDQRVINT